MDYLRFVLALIVVMGLILLLGVIFRKLVMSGSFLQGAFLLKKAKSESHKPINIKESRVLDTRRRIMVLRYGDYEYVLLLTHHGDMLLDKIACDPADEGVDEAMNASDAGRKAIQAIRTTEKSQQKNDKSLINNTGKKPQSSKKTAKIPTR